PPPPPPPPPQPPPAPPPGTTKDEAPKLSDATFRLFSGAEASSEPRLITLEAAFRVCDDSQGKLLAVVTEKRVRLKKTIAEGSFRRSLAGTADNCRNYRLNWRVATKFLGAGVHTVSLRVRDAAGHWSKPVMKTYKSSG
nr:hypothetical protein [Actinomycetota bacterium]